MPATAATASADLAATMAGIGKAARAAQRRLALATTDEKNRALTAAADALIAREAQILAANARDLDAARAAGRPAAFLDRLKLDPQRLAAIAQALRDIAALPDPVGRVLASWTRPNGLNIERVATPLGVVGIIYESRPNVTADAGGLALKAGNAAILRAGSDSLASALAIHAALVEGLQAAGLPEAAIQVVPVPDRDAVGLMLAGLDGAMPAGPASPDSSRAACCLPDSGAEGMKPEAEAAPASHRLSCGEMASVSSSASAILRKSLAEAPSRSLATAATAADCAAT